jgi:hypothetical protein
MITETVFQELMVETVGSGEAETALPLPMDHVFYKFSTSERRTQYDYAVEVSSLLDFKSTQYHNTHNIIGCKQAGLIVKSQRVGP